MFSECRNNFDFMDGRLSKFTRAFLNLEGNILLHHQLLYNNKILDMVTKTLKV
ncbi:hypothetical protein Hanom_Chr09g00812841 [Helianthus anomalus]